MIKTIDGAAFSRMMLSAAAEIDLNKQKVNELNVFPVPDGDTGTNMSMTLSAASTELRKADGITLTKAADKTASALLRYLVDMAGDLKRKLIALIDRVFPEYEAQFDTIFCKSSVAVLKKYPTPQKLSNAHLDKLTELLWNSSNGHFGEWKARELKELARNSFGVEDCDGAYSTLILLMLDQIQSLSGKADALEKEISRLFQSFDTTVTTIPGVGPIIGAVILSEVGDISRFSSADKLAAYIGVDPSVNQSGEFQAAHAHMSKRGSPYLRRCIWMASQVAVQRDPMFRAYYEKKAAEGLKYMTIIGHVTRKMTAVIFAILRDHKVYEPVLPTAA